MKVRGISPCGLWRCLLTVRVLIELDYVFAVPTTKHMTYQTNTVLPYWFKTNILRKKGLESPSLYKNFEFSDSGEEFMGGGNKEV